MLHLLIDSDCTHNFLNIRIAKQLGCILESISELKVIATNGNELICNEICKNFVWRIQSYNFKAD